MNKYTIGRGQTPLHTKDFTVSLFSNTSLLRKKSHTHKKEVTWSESTSRKKKALSSYYPWASHGTLQLHSHHASLTQSVQIQTAYGGDTQECEDKENGDVKSTCVTQSSLNPHSKHSYTVVKEHLLSTAQFFKTFSTWQFLHLRKLSQNGAWANSQRSAFTLPWKRHSASFFLDLT